MISERTKLALAAAKARGTKLGNPRAAEALVKARAAIVYPQLDSTTVETIVDLRLRGLTLAAIASRLNLIGVRTARGSAWHIGTVDRVLSRYDESTQERDNAIVQALYDEFVLSHFSCLNGSGSHAMPCETAPSAGRGAISHGKRVMFDLAEAYKMLDTFASVGAMYFDVTFLDMEGKKRGFRPHQTARQLRNSLPQLIRGLEERQQNIIVRPICDKTQLVQLDDLNYEQLKQVAPISFLILETSPGNHQAWVAVTEVKDDAKDLARRLRKGTGADPAASGATRVGGTVNYKVKYASSFPTVKVLLSAPGRTTTQQQLEALHILAKPDPVALATPIRVFSEKGRSWPDYQRCFQGAPMKNGENKPDISRADFFWCFLAAQRGWSSEETASRLMQLSSKAQENGQGYAELTADNALEACDRQRRGRA